MLHNLWQKFCLFKEYRIYIIRTGLKLDILSKYFDILEMSYINIPTHAPPVSFDSQPMLIKKIFSDFPKN